MKNLSLIKLLAITTSIALILTACGGSTTKTDDTSQEEAQKTEVSGTVEITDINGTVEVPVNPQRVVALDNRTFETLADWGVEPVAVPKPVLPPDSPFANNDAIEDVGSHREPNLEIIAAVDPDLVIVGQRFASFADDIKALVPNAAVINLNFDVSEEAASAGDNLKEGLINSTFALGQIFDKAEEAEVLIADFIANIEQATEAYNGQDTVMAVVVSGGEIGFSAPSSGRVWGPMYEIFGWVPALSVDDATSDHQGDDVSVEAIAQSNPDWLFVLDRDAATSSNAESSPAQDVIDNAPALQNVRAITEGNIVYAPADTYTNESIQTYIQLFGDLARAFAQ